MAVLVMGAKIQIGRNFQAMGEALPWSRARSTFHLHSELREKDERAGGREV